MASHAEIANDLAAHAAFYDRRDNDVARVCRDCACLIRMLMVGEKVDGRTYRGAHQRLLNLSSRHRTRTETTIARSLDRGLTALTELYAEAVKRERVDAAR